MGFIFVFFVPSQGLRRLQGNLLPCIFTQPHQLLLPPPPCSLWWTRQHDSAEARTSPPTPLSSFSSLSCLPPQVSARACFHCRLSFPLLFPSLLTLRQVALAALPLSRLPCVAFLFKKKSDNAATSIAHRNTHQTTREFREQLGSCEMAGAKARARSPERRRNGGGRCHKKRRRSLS